MMEHLKQATAANSLHYAANVPKELGILQRLEGLNGGLCDLRSRLENFSSRLGFGHPPGAAGSSAPMPSGITTQIGSAEEQMRECIAILTRLNDLF